MEIYRRLMHIFKSGVILLGIEHFLAMFPATILVPLMVNNSFETTVIDVALVLLTSGVGTILFLIASKGKIPAYLGSSFAYIGLTIYLISGFQNQSVEPSMAYVYVGWAYLFAGVFLFILSKICKYRYITKILTFLFPTPIIGPAISLIGLELASTAIRDSGFNSATFDVRAPIISIITLLVIIMFSVTKHKFLKNAAIVVGMVIGCICASMLNIFSLASITPSELLKIPNIKFPLHAAPPNIVGLCIAVIPATFVIFMENIGRLTIIERMINNYGENEPIFNNTVIGSFKTSLLSHSLATIAAALAGSVPNTIYTENIAVMSIHSNIMDNNKMLEDDKFIKELYNPFSCIPYVIAAVLAILVSFVGALQTLLLSVPQPVIGGIELFLFGIISAPGIQLLVEQRINYKKISNQLLTASVLISGISGLSVNLGFVELKGMSLGFTIGVVLNLIFQIIKHMGILNDHISFEEIFYLCVKNLTDNWKIKSVKHSQTLSSISDELVEDDTLKNMMTSDIVKILDGNVNHGVKSNSGQALSTDYVRAIITSACDIVIKQLDQSDKFVIVTKTMNNQAIKIRGLSEKTINHMLNDYNDSCDYSTNDKCLVVNINGNIPDRIIISMLKEVSKNVS